MKRETSSTGSDESRAHEPVAEVVHVGEGMHVRPSSAARQAARSSASVSGPKVVNVKRPRGLSTRATSAKTASRSSHQGSIRLLKTRSKLGVRQRQRLGLGRAAIRCAVSSSSRAASRSMPGEASSATTRALGQRAASAAAPWPVPQPRSRIASGREVNPVEAVDHLLAQLRPRGRRTRRSSRSRVRSAGGWRRDRAAAWPDRRARFEPLMRRADARRARHEPLDVRVAVRGGERDAQARACRPAP